MADAVDTPEFVGTDRFVVKDKVGGGGMGDVYRAFDRERGIDLALKLLRGEDPTALYRFKQEFRMLADIQHRNLVEFYELVSADEQWFVTMEFVDGVDILAYVRRGFGQEAGPGARHVEQPSASAAAEPRGKARAESSHGFDDPEETDVGDTRVTESWPTLAPPSLDSPEQFARLRATFLQLAEGVDALHRAGRLHRDIKPSNVIVARDGRVVLLDFGVMTELARRDDQDAALIVGTPAYMAPEQSVGGTLSPKSDWYSVGVVLYEALTGRRPFGAATRQSLGARGRFEPTQPRSFVPEIPEDLNSLCTALLAPLAENRPGGEEVLRRLGGADDPTVTPVDTESLLVGRERHLEVLRSTFAQVCAGKQRTLFVSGRAGMGKTALVQHFLDEIAERDDTILLAGRCYEHESVPYKALDSLVDALCQHLLSLPRHEVEQLIPEDVWTLARLFPVLRRVEAVGGRAAPLEEPTPSELRRAAFRVLRELLGALARRKRVVIYVDDLQWGDRDSAAILEEIVRPPDAPPLLFIAAYRSEDEDSSALLTDLLPRILDRVEVSVQHLTRDDAVALAVTLLGDVCKVLPNMPRSIARESGGSPFFLRELVRYVHTESFNDMSLGTIAVEDVVRSRVMALSPGARQMLNVIAIAGRPIKQATARRAADLGGEEEQAVALLRASHLIRTRGGRQNDAFETYHDRIREIAVASMSDTERRQYHQELALALATERDPDPEALALHFDGAGQAERAASLYVKAARNASDALAFDRAARLYQRGLDLRPAEGPAAVALRAELGNVLGYAGQGWEAGRVLLEAAELSNATDALEYRRLAAEHYLRCGRYDDGIDLISAVLRDVGLRAPVSARPSLYTMLAQRLKLRLRGLKFKLRNEGELSPVELHRLDVVWTAALGLAMVDTLGGVEFQTRYLHMALQAGEPYRLGRALTMEAGLTSVAGRRNRRRCTHLLDLAAQVLDSIDAEDMYAWVCGIRGFTSYQWGEFHEAELQCREAEEIMRKHGKVMFFEWSLIQLYVLWALYYQGKIGEIVARHAGVLRESENRGDRYSVTNLSTGLMAITWLARDEPDEARAASEAAIANWSHRGYHLQHYWSLLAEMHVALYVGPTAATWERITTDWPTLNRTFLKHLELVGVEARSFRGRCAVALAHGEAATAMLQDAERMARDMEKRKLEYGVALAALLRAGIAQRRGQHDAAVALLERAEREFGETGMRLHQCVARRQRGIVLGGEEGAELVTAADEWMRAQSIVRPDRMARLVAPGFETVTTDAE